MRGIAMFVRVRPTLLLAVAASAIAAALLAAALLAVPRSLAAQDFGQPATQGVPYVPTPWPVVAAMLELARVGADDFVLDLGSGDGRVVIEAARTRGARGLGVELDADLVRISNDEAKRLGVGARAKFLQQDLFETDLTQASVITMYLLPELIRELRPRLATQLATGTRIVSHDFDMGDWRPDAQAKIEVPRQSYGPASSTVYLWIVPAFVQGQWAGEVRIGARSEAYRLDLRQLFQSVSGTLAVGGRSGKLDQATLTGDRIVLSAVVGTGSAQLRHRFEARSVAGDLVGRWSVSPLAAPAGTPTAASGVETRARRVEPGAGSAVGSAAGAIPGRPSAR